MWCCQQGSALAVNFLVGFEPGFVLELLCLRGIVKWTFLSLISARILPLTYTCAFLLHSIPQGSMHRNLLDFHGYIMCHCSHWFLRETCQRFQTLLFDRDSSIENLDAGLTFLLPNAIGDLSSSRMAHF